MIRSASKDLWSLVLDQPQVDPVELVEAIEEQVRRGDLDYRSRLLIHDSLDALADSWGKDRLLDWLQRTPERATVEDIWHRQYEKLGFPFLKNRIMEATRPETVRQFFRELSQHVSRPVRLEVAGAIALILPGYLTRRTEDIDVVNEVPEELRSQHAVLGRLAERYGLELGHVQSHYFPKDWQQRLHSLEPFGQLQIALIDVYDVFLSKLFSARDKDRDDLRMLLPQLDKETIVRKLRETTQDMLAAAGLREKAEKNWYILTGESLPS
jgi:hypothetical protein